MKVGLFITSQLLDITQAGYQVAFQPGLPGVIKVELLNSSKSEFYDAIDCGKVNGSREKLEKDIINALSEFRNLYSIPSTNHEDTDTGSKSKDGEESSDSDSRNEELDNTGALA